MKFSESIRAGDVYPEVHGPIFSYNGGSKCGACAIGGAIAAAGLASNYMEVGANGGLWTIVNKAWPYTTSMVVCPVPECLLRCQVGDMVVHLYENEGWSKKAIAELVETIENKMEAEKLEPVPEVKAEEPVKCTV